MRMMVMSYAGHSSDIRYTFVSDNDRSEVRRFPGSQAINILHMGQNKIAMKKLINKRTIQKIKIHFMSVEPDPAPALGGQSFDSDHRSSGLMRTSSKLEHSKLQ